MKPTFVAIMLAAAIAAFLPLISTHADESRDKAGKDGISWTIAANRIVGNTKADVIKFKNSNADQQYTIKFKLSFGGTNSLTANQKRITKKEIKLVLEPNSVTEYPVTIEAGFGYSGTPSVELGSLVRTRTKK